MMRHSIIDLKQFAHTHHFFLIFITKLQSLDEVELKYSICPMLCFSIAILLCCSIALLLVIPYALFIIYSVHPLLCPYSTLFNLCSVRSMLCSPCTLFALYSVRPKLCSSYAESPECLVDAEPTSSTKLCLLRFYNSAIYIHKPLAMAPAGLSEDAFYAILTQVIQDMGRLTTQELQVEEVEVSPGKSLVPSSLTCNRQPHSFLFHPINSTQQTRHFLRRSLTIYRPGATQPCHFFHTPFSTR